MRKDNIVGSYYMLNAKPVTTVLFGQEDETWEDEWQEEVEEKFGLWAESLDNWPDAARLNSLTGLVRMFIDSHTITGEGLASVEWLRDQPRMFNTAIQILDTDRLSTPPDRWAIRWCAAVFVAISMGHRRATMCAWRIQVTG